MVAAAAFPPTVMVGVPRIGVAEEAETAMDAGEAVTVVPPAGEAAEKVAARATLGTMSRTARAPADKIRVAAFFRRGETSVSRYIPFPLGTEPAGMRLPRPV